MKILSALLPLLFVLGLTGVLAGIGALVLWIDGRKSKGFAPKKWVIGIQRGDKELRFDEPVTLLEALNRRDEL